MTTTNIQNLKQFLADADEAHTGLVQSVEDRAQQLVDEATAAQREREVAKLEYELAQRHAKVAERARQQLHDDESKQRDEADAERDEEAGQLRFILGDGEPEVREAEPQVSNDEPEPQAPEPEVHVVPPVADDFPHPPVESVVERTTEQPAVETYSGRPSSGLELLMAIVGLILGLVIAGNSVDWVFQAVSNAIGFGLLAIGWFISWGALGFFSFGWLGWKFQHRN